jgi:peptidoglycan/LPS O-acetylase OafA/YrhL
MTTLARPPAVSRTTPRSVRTFRPDIEGLRAVAVTLVVLNHLDFGFSGGFVGVDVFFVISGFLITRQLMSEYEKTNHISFAGFYARRARRILPAATVVIVGTLLATRVWDSPLRVRADALDGLFSAFSGINWRLAAQGTNYFALGTAPSPFQHYWSLAVEEQFYAIWPLLIVIVGATVGRRYGRRTSIVWSVLLIMAASLSLSVVSSAGSPSWAYFGIQTRAWELGFGALLGITVALWTRMPPALSCQMSWLGLGLILVAALVYGPATVYPGAAAILPVVGSAFVIAGGCPGWARSGELLLRRSPFQLVGRVSYSWYLVHWPILMVLPMALGHSLSDAEKAYVLGGSLAVAIAMFYLVERPIRSRTFLVRRPQLGLGFGAVLASGSVAVALVLTHQATSLVPTGAAAAQRIAPTADLDVIGAAVAAGAALTALPANVTPPLAKAATDKPSSTNGCLAPDSSTTLAPDSLCTFGDPQASRTMVLVGDSHANGWQPAVDAFAKANHWRFILMTKAACSPGIYLTYIDPITNRLYTQCNFWRNAMFARVAELKPDVVLINSEIRTVDIDPTGMVQSIRKFQADGARVIYLEDTPNPDKVGSIPDCLAAHAVDVAKCSLPRAAGSTRLEGMIQRRVEAAAAKAAGAALIDPTPWFCTETTCPPVINDTVVYADASHTTASYVKWLAPVMTEALVKATGGT